MSTLRALIFDEIIINRIRVVYPTLTLLLGAAHLFDGGQGRVQLQSTEEVANVESVDSFVGAVVDSPNEVHAYNTRYNISLGGTITTPQTVYYCGIHIQQCIYCNLIA